MESGHHPIAKLLTGLATRLLFCPRFVRRDTSDGASGFVRIASSFPAELPEREKRSHSWIVRKAVLANRRRMLADRFWPGFGGLRDDLRPTMQFPTLMLDAVGNGVFSIS
jgi:hypothetical protein